MTIKFTKDQLPTRGNLWSMEGPCFRYEVGCLVNLAGDYGCFTGKVTKVIPDKDPTECPSVVVLRDDGTECEYEMGMLVSPQEYDQAHSDLYCRMTNVMHPAPRHRAAQGCADSVKASGLSDALGHVLAKTVTTVLANQAPKMQWEEATKQEVAMRVSDMLAQKCVNREWLEALGASVLSKLTAADKVDTLVAKASEFISQDEYVCEHIASEVVSSHLDIWDVTQQIIDKASDYIDEDDVAAQAAEKIADNMDAYDLGSALGSHFDASELAEAIDVDHDEIASNIARQYDAEAVATAFTQECMDLLARQVDMERLGQIVGNRVMDAPSRLTNAIVDNHAETIANHLDVTDIGRFVDYDKLANHDRIQDMVKLHIKTQCLDKYEEFHRNMAANILAEQRANSLFGRFKRAVRSLFIRK